MIRLRDGVHIEASDGRTVVADARSTVGDLNVVSHAHADHIPQNADATIVCSPLTAKLAGTRRSTDVDAVEAAPGISLVNAGHITGSRAARIERDDRTILYTGDVCTRDRFYLDGFEPIDADVLVIESTYGRPHYRFPEHDAVVSEIVDWIADHADRPLLLFGYPLGRAQMLQYLVGTELGRRPIVHSRIHRLTQVVEAETAIEFESRILDEDRDLGPGDVVVLPTGVTNSAIVTRAREERNALAAGFSGWAVDGGFRFGGDFDRTFPLSDHCDYDELVELVHAVDPDRVYTHHGFAETFADRLATDHGFDARPLLRNQSTLADF